MMQAWAVRATCISLLFHHVFCDLTASFKKSAEVRISTIGSTTHGNIALDEDCVKLCMITKGCEGGAHSAHFQQCHLTSRLFVDRTPRVPGDELLSFVMITEEEKSCEISFEQVIQRKFGGFKFDEFDPFDGFGRFGGFQGFGR